MTGKAFDVKAKKENQSTTLQKVEIPDYPIVIRMNR
jgi:hypothetical protein